MAVSWNVITQWYVLDTILSLFLGVKMNDRELSPRWLLQQYLLFFMCFWAHIPFVFVLTFESTGWERFHRTSNLAFANELSNFQFFFTSPRDHWKLGRQGLY